MSADSVVSIAWDLLKCAVTKIERPIRYVMSSKSFAEGLRNEVQNLENEVQRVNVLAERARNNGRYLLNDFTTWEKNYNDALKEAQDLLGDFEKATKTCCHGTLPDPNCRYQFSRKAKGKIEVIKQLAQKCSGFKDLDDIAFIDPAPGNVAALNPTRREGKDVVQSTTATASVFSASTSIKLRDDDIFESRAQIMQEIKHALANNSNSVVGVHGMGGLGKSTLLEQVKRIISEEKSFDWVAKADVSKNPDIKTIQEEIAYALGLDKIRENESVSLRAELLRRRLEEEARNKKKVLIILDNLWEGLDLKKVGIPCGHDNKVMGCKLLLTSRHLEVLESEMGCDKNFPLGVLKKEEAKRLFGRMVGDKVHDYEFKPLVDVAVDKCAGVPFLIVAMAKRFKNASFPEWKDTLKKIEKSKDKKINDSIDQMLQWSYDKLEEEVKSLLRLCVVYGISTPSLENLVRYSVGLELFRDVSSMEDARNRLSSHIRTLQASSLLLDSEDVDGFKIHDLVRDFIASVSSSEEPLLVLKDKAKSEIELLKDKPNSYRAICFPYVDMEKLPQELDCPELRIFLLFTNNRSLHVSNSLFNSMRKLMVLNLSGMHLARSTLSFQFLKNLHTLCLDDCSLEDVAILGELKGLQILSFVNSKIQRLPKEIGQLVELRLLDLNDCSRLQIIEPGVLERLIKLEELYINSFNQWNAMEQTPPTNASLMELNNLKNLCTLHASIPNPSVLPENLNFKQLTKYKIKIGDAWRWSEYKGSRTLELRLDPVSDVLQKGCIQSILDRTDDLLLDRLRRNEQSICQVSLKGFPQLKHLYVQNSPSVRYIQGSSLPAFKTLQLLFLENLINLEKLCHNDISSKSFSTLKVLRVKSCHKMEVLFPRSLVRELPQLEEIKVVDCNFMQGIVEADDCDKVELHNLRVLQLRRLPDIKNFFITRTTPSSCTLDDPVGTQISFFNGQQVAFPRLETLEIKGLHNLEFMFFPSMVKSLAQLKKLTVSYCKKMEAIITEEEGLGMATSDTVTFQMLTDLQLIELKSLTCFSRGKCSQEARSQDRIKSLSTALFNREVAFPSLETLYISGLDNIEMTWDNQVVADSFPKLKSLFVYGCNKLVNVVPSFILGRLLSLERLNARNCGSLEVVFELRQLNPLDGHPIAFQLKELEISRLPKLKCVWDKELHRQVKFQCLRSISVSSCESLTSLFPASVARDLMQLEELKIDKCGIMELIEKEEGLVPRFVFPNLTSLKLEHLTELKCLYTGTHTSHWPALKTLMVVGCNKVETLASQTENEMPRHKQPLFLIEKGAFPNLQELKLDLSERMEILHGHFHDEEFSCRLRVLELCYLSKESAISTCHFVESLTNLEELVVSKSYLEEPSSNEEAIEGTSNELKVILPFQGYIHHLQTLHVSHCDGLSNMFTTTIAENLVALTKLKISNCRILTIVISDEEGEEGRVVAFNRLKYIELDGLIELRCFSSGKSTLMLPLLEDVIVTECPNMKFFSKGPIKAPKLEKVQVSTDTWFWKENLNITIQNMFEEMATIAKVECMWLSEFPELIGKWHSELNPIKSSWQLESLAVDKCPSFINAIPSKLMLVLDNTRRLQVRDCESLEEIFDLEGLEGVESTRVPPSFRTLELVNLPKLKRLWNKDLQGLLPYNFLYSITLYKCSNLRHAFSPSMGRCLANLAMMEIKECDQMEGVITEEEGQESTMEKSIFPNLKLLKLECLPNLTSFLLGMNHTLECLELNSLTIAYCPKMRSLTWQSLMEIEDGTPSLFTPRVLFPELESIHLSHMDNLSKIWMDGPQETLTFDYLWEVEVQNCKSLENLFPHWVATSLNNIKKLGVESCELEEIVVSGDDTPDSSTTQVFFPKLTSLVLHNMPRLKSFCPNLPTLNWPLLEELRVTHCNKVNMLSFAASLNKWTQENDQGGLSDQEAHSLFERDLPSLEKLLLVDEDIQMILDGKFPDDIFSKPEALTLACFHDENAIFPPKFFLERFRNLQSLEVFCSSFEDIVLGEGLVDEGKHSMLENLRALKLSKLCNLKRVWREDYLVSQILQRIETLEVWECPSLTTLFPDMTSFQNLTKLVVKNSAGLVYLVKTSAVTNLVHLTDMTIIGCEKMEEVVANDGNEEGKVISLGKLSWLELRNLQSLECFSSTTNCIFKFPSLEYIIVEECPKMKIFSKGILSTPQLYSGKLFRYNWRGSWRDDLNTIIQKLSA